MSKIRDPFFETPEGFHDAVENALDKLEEKEMKRQIRWSALAVAAVFVMLAATGFAAAGLVRGFVDWNGNFTPVESPVGPNPTPTPPPVPAANTAEETTRIMHKLIENVPEMEYWEAMGENQGSGKYGAYKPMIDTMDELLRTKAGFDDADIVLPEGYEFIRGEIYYALENLIGDMYSEENVDGIMLRKYHLIEPDDEDREGYWLNAMGSNDASVSLSVFVYPSLEEAVNATGTFYVNEEDEYSVLNVEGAQKAIMIKRETGLTDIAIIRVTDNGKAFIYNLHGNEFTQKEEMLSFLRF